jgi:hypothetical protein
MEILYIHEDVQHGSSFWTESESEYEPDSESEYEADSESEFEQTSLRQKYLKQSNRIWVYCVYMNMCTDMKACILNTQQCCSPEALAAWHLKSFRKESESHSI